jgi:hypothetical protein
MFNKTMRYGMFTILFLVISACSTPKLEGFKEPKLVERAEVIRAQKDCIDARMKPVIQTLPQETAHGTIMFPVAVNCETYSAARP